MIARPDAVESGVGRLKRCETVSDHEKRAKEIIEAFKLLDSYLRENPDSEHREFIENSKRSYMRRHLECLSAVDQPDSQTWGFNIVLFSMADREVDQILAQFPTLRPWYSTFVDSCPEMRKALLRALEAQQSAR